MIAQKFLDGHVRLRKEVESHDDMKFLMWAIVRQFTYWIAVYPADRSDRPYQQQIGIIITLLRKSHKLLIAHECCYSILPIYKSKNTRVSARKLKKKRAGSSNTMNLLMVRVAI